MTIDNAPEADKSQELPGQEPGNTLTTVDNSQEGGTQRGQEPTGSGDNDEVRRVQKQVEDLRKEAATRRVQLREAEQRAEETLRRLQAAEEATVTFEGQTTELTQRLRQASLELHVTREAAERQLHPTLVADLVRTSSDIEWGDDHNPTNLSEILDGMVERYGDAIRVKPASTVSSSSMNQQSERKQKDYTREDLMKMDPKYLAEHLEEIVPMLRNMR